MIMKKPTIKDLEGMNTYEADQYLQTLLPEYPDRPSKPRLDRNHTVAEARQYTKALAAYEKLMPEYRIKEAEYRQFSSECYELLREKIKEDSGLNSIVPEQYRDKIWSLAWERGHSSGYSEVEINLIDLIDIFRP